MTYLEATLPAHLPHLSHKDDPIAQAKAADLHAAVEEAIT